jgi:uncharacterized protein (TIGR02265 family)
VVLADRAMALIAPHCDIVERLSLTPPSAQVRGVFLRNIERQLEKWGQLEKYKRYFSDEPAPDHAFCYLGDYLVRIACAGALVASPRALHEGVFRIAKGNASTFVESLLGRLMLRSLSTDPWRLMEQGLAARRQSFTYGHWDLVRHEDGFMEIVHRSEYVWLESEIAGAALGTFEPLGISDVRTVLVDRFNGSTLIRW